MKANYDTAERRFARKIVVVGHARWMSLAARSCEVPLLCLQGASYVALVRTRCRFTHLTRDGYWARAFLVPAGRRAASIGLCTHGKLSYA